MPCDTEYDQSNLAIYNEVLQDLVNIVNNENIDYCLCGDDFNTDISRCNSLHTKALQDFMAKESFGLSSQIDIDYTYESASNRSTSIIDHFIMSDNLLGSISNVHVKHHIDNTSDHSILCLSLAVNVQHAHVEVQNEAKLMWTSASDQDITRYRCELDNELQHVYMDPLVMYCNNHMCTVHHDCIESLHNNIINSCLNASKCIPTSKSVQSKSDKYVPGWNDYVKSYRTYMYAMFWHVLYGKATVAQKQVILQI